MCTEHEQKFTLFDPNENLVLCPQCAKNPKFKGKFLMPLRSMGRVLADLVEVQRDTMSEILLKMNARVSEEELKRSKRIQKAETTFERLF